MVAIETCLFFNELEKICHMQFLVSIGELWEIFGGFYRQQTKIVFIMFKQLKQIIIIEHSLK